MRRLPVVLAALAAAGVASAGCGGDSDASSGAGPPKTAAASTGDTSASAAAPSRQAPRRGVRLVRIGSFSSPLYVTAPPGDRRRIFVVEQDGRIVAVRGGRKLARPFLDVRSRVTSGGEQGLLSLAFAPDYARSGRFYVYYTERSGTESIWEYRR